MERVVILGAGQAGAALAARLRSGGFGGTVTLIGEETAPPYQRPPLSKKYLMGEMARERLYLRPESFYAQNGIELRTGLRAERIDRDARRVHAGGETFGYDALALTLGAVPRRLPPAVGGDLAGVHVVRTLADVDAMRPAFRAGARLVVVGGGYIGLETAAVGIAQGLHVTLVEMSARILGRVAAPETSAWFRALHRARGVDLREGVGLTRLLPDRAGRVAGALLSDGSELPADLVVAGIGIDPATALAAAARIELENGIRTDAQGRTSDPAIWAAGDCASFPWRGRRVRLESVQNAIDQAELVADNILGAGRAYDPHPWFWSDQYDVKLQIAGLSAGYDSVTVRRGAGDAVSHWYYGGATLLAVDAMNDPRAYMIGKRLIEAGRSPAPQQVADPSADLKALLKP